MSELVGVDVGGTFTDCVALGDDGSVVDAKVLSTPNDPSLGFVEGLRALSGKRGQSLEAYCGSITRIVHGTTVATNAALTGRGARTALLTTEGFRDALEMREGVKEDQYDNRYVAPPPLVPRFLRLGVPERVNREGQVLVAPQRVDLKRAIATIRKHDVEAVAVSFMHSYANGENERFVGAALEELAPDLHVTLSSELLPQIRFYERTSTSAFNAYVGPILARYLSKLMTRLDDLGFGGQLLVMQSNGGVVPPAQAAKRSAGALLSGPAAGPVAGGALATAAGHFDCITADMGGTSFDVAVVREGRPLMVRDSRFDRRVVALPTTDIHAIGAGGGSIGWIDDGGLLRMGPASAGAQPGPACYGFGGRRPTCTDANVVLGLLDASYFAGGRIQLHADIAAEAIERDIAGPLGISVTEAAAGMHHVINVNMAMGVRAVSVNRGLDPRGIPLVVGGGCGPVHAARIAEELDIPLVMVPRSSGLLCAVGMLLSDFRHDYVRTALSPLAEVDWDHINRLVDAMIAEGESALIDDGVGRPDRQYKILLDIRYASQHREIEVPCTLEELGPHSGPALRSRFGELHEKLYGHSLPDAALELVTVRVHAVGVARKLPLPELPEATSSVISAQRSTRNVYIAERDAYQEIPAYDGQRLEVGHVIHGPAVVDDPNTSVFVPPAYQLRCDARESRVLIRTSNDEEH